MRLRRVLVSTSFCTIALASGLASAGELNSSQDPAIYGGEATEPCAWPSQVTLGGCSATLVHPQVIVYAAHCGSNYGTVRFGENDSAPARTVALQYCRTNPDYQSAPGTDQAYCVLEEPIFDVPIVPPVMGCEVDELLVEGAEVVLVGMGQADAGPGYGQKREAWTTLQRIQDNEALLGGNGIDPCSGDSGGPAYVRAKDGSWRVFGIVSYGPIPCGGGSWYSMMHVGMPWIEGELAEFGVDLTPCHDSDGAWNPSEMCGAFPLDSHQSLGAWPDTCGMGGEVSGLSDACGPAFGAPNDGDDPEVAIILPMTMQTFMTESEATVNVRVEVEATDPGDGVAEVELSIDGAVIPGGVDKVPPYVWNLAMPPGGYTLQARAVDFHDNDALSDYVVIGIDEDAPEPPPPPMPSEESGEESGDGGTEGEAEASGTSDGPTLDEDGGKGCGCQSSEQGPVPAGLGLLMLGLVGLRRRRRNS